MIGEVAPVLTRREAAVFHNPGEAADWLHAHATSHGHRLGGSYAPMADETVATAAERLGMDDRHLPALADLADGTGVVQGSGWLAEAPPPTPATMRTRAVDDSTGQMLRGTAVVCLGDDNGANDGAANSLRQTRWFAVKGTRFLRVDDLMRFSPSVIADQFRAHMTPLRM